MIILTKRELEIENLRIDLMEIKYILKNKKNIMKSEYDELYLKQKLIINKLYNKHG